MPTSSFDTFFACTILVAAALIGTAFLASTIQTRIASTEDLNKDSYLKAIADHIITSTGSPADWGANSALPVDFGLAEASQTAPYELDIDKISRLNNLNIHSLSYADMENTAKLSNIALGIAVSQIMTLNVSQYSNSTVGGDTSFTFTVSASIDSKPAAATLHCYVAANNYLNEINSAIPDSSVGQVTVQIPDSAADNAVLIVFARASIDDRITSFAIYNFAKSTQESTPSSTELDLSSQNYTLSLNNTLPSITVQEVYLFSYTYQQTLSPIEDSQVSIPKLLDKSPMVLVACSLNGTEYFQEWTAYPQVPLKAGSSFEGSEQNIFSYIVTIDGVLYKLDLSLGDLPK